jgi:general secretion pathway protein G
MKNRKRGFSLVELLIVLAVIAALIATITPVALNAIRKAKATQVAQNLKTLASALENAAYVNGTLSTGAISNASGSDIEIGDLGRDIDATKYGIVYAQTSGTFEAVIYYIGGDAAPVSVAGVLAEATSTAPTSLPNGTFSDTLGIPYATGTNYIYYKIDFTVY